MENVDFDRIDELDILTEDEDISASSSNETINQKEESSVSNPFSGINEDLIGSIVKATIEEQKLDQINQNVPIIETLPNEIGRVKDVGLNEILVAVTTDAAFEQNLIDHHVIFRTITGLQIVGTVSTLNSEFARVKLIGEIVGGRFIPGVLSKPSIGNVCFIATEEEIQIIVTDNKNNNVSGNILLGTMPLYNNTPAYVSVNSFFSNHFAIFGNTGSGKSCGVSRVLQNSFFHQPTPPKNACIFIFDAYGEYESALSIQNTNIYFKRYSTNVQKQNIIKLPLWLLDLDDFALLLDVDDQAQLPIIEKALRLVTVFAGDEKEKMIYKNDIIAKAILEVLYSGGAASVIHDQILAILTSYNTKELNLETPVMQPGYTRTLRQCLIIDKEGKIGEIQLVSEFMKKFINNDLKLSLPDGTIPFTLENLKEAFDYALISEGTLKSNKMYDKANVLKVRLESLIKSEYAEYFKYDRYIDKVGFIKELITASNGARAQIININISYLDDRLAKTICKIYSKLLFDFTSKLQNRGTFPVHLIIEEAHRYVQNDSDINILGYNIFDRIAKEGRKYGVLMGLISQRPSELSETSLSQCSNFLIFRMQHPHDVEFIKKMVPNVTDEVIEQMKSLQPGTCVAFGSGFKLPAIVKLEMPNPSPMSQNVDLTKLWY